MKYFIKYNCIPKNQWYLHAWARNIESRNKIIECNDINEKKIIEEIKKVDNDILSDTDVHIINISIIQLSIIHK